jgi:hypothetical protein
MTTEPGRPSSLATRGSASASVDAGSASVPSMTERTRRPRGAAKGNPVVYGHVAPEAKDVVTATADALGISQAQAIEAILLALSLDTDGVPSVLDRTRFHREELPIPAA